MLDIRNLSASVDGKQILKGLTLSIQPGEVHAIMGPNGSGKSTLLRVIAGLERPDAGTVLIGREEVTSKPARSRGVGFVFQHYAAFKHMTVADNVAFGLTVRRRPKDERKAKVKELLDQVQAELRAAE